MRTVLSMSLAGAALVTGVITGGAGQASADPGTGSEQRATHSRADENRLRQAGIDVDRMRPDWSIKDDEVVWDDGEAMLSIQPAAAEDCSSGYTCLWADKSYTGRRLQFRDTQLANLTDYGYNDQMSSWYNRNTKDARWYKNISGGGDSRCMQDGARVSDVGAGTFNTDNDEASSLRIYSNGTTC